MKKTIYIILGILAALMAAIFLIPLPSYIKNEEEKKAKNGQVIPLYGLGMGCVGPTYGTYYYKRQRYLEYVCDYWSNKYNQHILNIYTQF